MKLIEAWRENRLIRCPICGSTYLLKKTDSGLWITAEVPNKIFRYVVLCDGRGGSTKFGVCLSCYYKHEKNIHEVIGTQPIMLMFDYRSYFLGSCFNLAVHGKLSNPTKGFVTYVWDKESCEAKKTIMI